MIYCDYDRAWGDDFNLAMANKDVSQMRVLHAFGLRLWGQSHCNTKCSARASQLLYRKRKLAEGTYNIRAEGSGFTVTVR